MNERLSHFLSEAIQMVKTVLSWLAQQLTRLTGVNGWLVLIGIVMVLIVIWRVTRLIKSSRSNTKPAYFDKDKHYSEQLHRVKLGGYELKPLLNKTEQAARKGILEAIYDEQLQGKLQLCAQVSLGEIITHPNQKLFRDINSKRVDFLLVDSVFMPVAVIEIHGQGHYLSADATQRDQIKQTVIESVGIQYLGIPTGSNFKQIQQLVKKEVLEKILR